jgi:hypothetical protein
MIERKNYINVGTKTTEKKYVVVCQRKRKFTLTRDSRIKIWKDCGSF